jgi:hypothetical protein
MKIIKCLSVIAIVTGLILLDSCKESFLEITPNGALDETVLPTYDGVDGLLISAYSMLDGVTSYFQGFTGNPQYDGWETTTSGWVFGSIRGMDANKGTDAGDQPYINPIQQYNETSENVYLNLKWKTDYESIARCNAVIKFAAIALENGNITADEAASFVRQARTLRGFYHFEAFRMWADMNNGTFIPYVDENTDWKTVTNDVDIRDKIIEDLNQGTGLPNDMKQVGRFNKTVAQVLLAKAYMQLYRDYDAALPLLTEVENSGTNPVGVAVGLEPLFGNIWDVVNKNGMESIYSVQASVNDGAGGWNGSKGEVLNFPYNNGPGKCCDFFHPTQDLVNSYRTDANGLPFLDTYNSEKVTNDQGLSSSDPFTEYAGQLDPRLDWTVGRRGLPYWDWGEHTGMDWDRNQAYSGPYTGKKFVYKKSQEGVYTDVGNWTSGFTANGYRLIRYADALLLKAECEAMTGADDLGMGEVNAVRTRASDPAGFLKEANGTTNAANYVIGLYPASAFADQASAMKVIKFERKLELAMEGHKYYDLQRWGDVVSELNRVLTYEKTMEWGPVLYGNATVGPEDVNFPLPQRQIDLIKGTLVQNR